MPETPKLVKAMILKGGVYLAAGLALFPGSLLVTTGTFAGVLAILATFFSLAAALGFFVGRSGIYDTTQRKVLLAGAIVSILAALGQLIYGCAVLMINAPAVTP